MRRFLMALFGAIFVWMIVMTTRTSMVQSILDAGPGFSANPWAVATLWDAYFGFTTFFVWVAWRERSMGARILWFVLIMALGNIAMSGYMLIQLARMKPTDSFQTLLLGRHAV
jgi:hypothetical protein